MKKSLFTEFIGTFFLIFVSGAIVILNKVSSKVDYLCVAVTFSTILGCLYAVFRRFGRSHFNPAVSFAYYITGKTDSLEFVLNVLAQFAGGLVACIMLLVIFANKFDNFILAVNRDILKYDDLSAKTVIGIFEFVFAFLLVAIYMAVDEQDSPLLAGIFLACGYFAMSSILIYIDGCGLNIVRIVVPALLYNKWTNIVYYVVSVCLGSLLGGITYSVLSHRSTQNVVK